jgi:hypothetical protein
MTVDWKQVLASREAARWLVDISNGIPDAVKQILASDEPPTFSDLVSLPQVQTVEAGVYARLTMDAGFHPGAKTNLVYIGMASSRAGGLLRRVHQHITGPNSRLGKLIDQELLEQEGT